MYVLEKLKAFPANAFALNKVCRRSFILIDCVLLLTLTILYCNTQDKETPFSLVVEKFCSSRTIKSCQARYAQFDANRQDDCACCQRQKTAFQMFDALIAIATTAVHAQNKPQEQLNRAPLLQSLVVKQPPLPSKNFINSLRHKNPYTNLDALVALGGSLKDKVQIEAKFDHGRLRSKCHEISPTIGYSLLGYAIKCKNQAMVEHLFYAEELNLSHALVRAFIHCLSSQHFS